MKVHNRFSNPSKEHRFCYIYETNVLSANWDYCFIWEFILIVYIQLWINSILLSLDIQERFKEDLTFQMKLSKLLLFLLKHVFIMELVGMNMVILVHPIKGTKSGTIKTLFIIARWLSINNKVCIFFYIGVREANVTQRASVKWFSFFPNFF